MTAWATPPFSIGGIPVDLPQAANLSLDQPAPSAGFSDFRLGSGRPRRQARWTRIKASISFDGYLPDGLSDLDWTAPLTVQWPMPRSMSSATNTATLPAARRSDYPPEAIAWVDGYPRPTPVTLVGNAATAIAVSNASRYVFAWWPEFEALIIPSTSGDRTKGTFQTHIELEEV
jgi:hypothetical protein